MGKKINWSKYTPATQDLGTTTQTGEDFVKKIGVVGCIMFSVMFILYLVACLSPAPDLLAGYEPPENMEYYAENVTELAEELENNVFPVLGDDIRCEVEDSIVHVYIPADSFNTVRNAILAHFDASLLEFSEAAQE